MGVFGDSLESFLWKLLRKGKSWAGGSNNISRSLFVGEAVRDLFVVQAIDGFLECGRLA